MDTEMVALEITASGAPWRAGPGDWETSATARSPVDKEKESSVSAKSGLTGLEIRTLCEIARVH